MINTMGKLMDAWYALLSGNITYNSVAVNVYKEDVPETETSHYVLLRAESEEYAGNKRSFADLSVVIVDIVTVFRNNIDRSVVESIDGQISALILPTWTNQLQPQTGMLILNLRREMSSFLTEEDDVNKYYRKVSRYKQLAYQTA